MLLEIHVRNLALIEKADIELEGGLTVLSGETGAGKSIIIDSIGLALGGKATKDIIRTGCDMAYVEAIFKPEGEHQKKMLRELDIIPNEDGTIIISRKISSTRSTLRINDETVTLSRMKQITGLLIDIHGQNEHQSLLSSAKQLHFIDAMLPKEAVSIKEGIKEKYDELVRLRGLLESAGDEAQRKREADILAYEINEIEEADLKEGEEQELASFYKKMKNSSRINESLSKAMTRLDTDDISDAIKDVKDISDLDEEIHSICSQLEELDGLLSDAVRSISQYLKDETFDEEYFITTEKRLDQIRSLEAKYSDDVSEILRICEQKRERLSFLENFDQMQAEYRAKVSQIQEQLEIECDRLSSLRKATSKDLEKKLVEELKALNFLNVDFEIAFSRLDEICSTGSDRIDFMISTNPGEPLKPLKDVASGGELSRIMLALKTVFADTDEIETLIFDEVDTGISGKTAQMVAQKLAVIATGHQVICITHLAQIASMADCHYLIEKSVESERTKTKITALERQEQLSELVRMIGGESSSDTIQKAAMEMKQQADTYKENMRRSR